MRDAHLAAARPSAASARRHAGGARPTGGPCRRPRSSWCSSCPASRSCPRRSRPSRRCWSTPPRKQVVLATPTTLIALLRTVSYAWTQQTLADKAREIHELGRDLHDRLVTMSGHLDRLGRSLTGAVSAYNRAVGLAGEPRAGLGPPVPATSGSAASELESPAPVVEVARPLTAAELLETGRRTAARAAGARRARRRSGRPFGASRPDAARPRPTVLGEHKRDSPPDPLGRGPHARSPGRQRRRGPGAAGRARRPARVPTT